MEEREWLAARFEAQRGHLRGVAYRMLGSLAEAEDAVQEVWLRLSRTDTSDVENLGGWLTTVTSRVCLDMLRTRKRRREESLTPETPLESDESRGQGTDATRANPEQEAVLADAVGLALLVVLETLNPAERLAFVLHDLFAVPFDEIAPIIERTPDAARQLASRARRRVQGAEMGAGTDIAHQRRVVDAFLAAARNGDFEALMSLLDPDVVQRMDRFVGPRGEAQVVQGAKTIAMRAKGGAQAAQTALIDGKIGWVVTVQGNVVMVLVFEVTDDRITAMDVIADPARLAEIDIAVFPD